MTVREARDIDRQLMVIAARARCCPTPCPDIGEQYGNPVVECRMCGMVLVAANPRRGVVKHPAAFSRP